MNGTDKIHTVQAMYAKERTNVRHIKKRSTCIPDPKPHAPPDVQYPAWLVRVQMFTFTK